MKVGDRVLWARDMQCAWTVTAINGYRITMVHRPACARLAPAKLELAIDEVIPAPANWRDAPERPFGWNKLTWEPRSDDAFQDELDEWAPRHKAWHERHRAPLLRRLQETGR